MLQRRPLILLEFNELCPPLLDRWIDAGLLPNFAMFLSRSQAFVAHADTYEPEDLQPWIQWYSLHTGLSYAQHGVRNLTDGPLASHRDIWSILGDAGLRVMNWGSMNAKAPTAADAVFLPDPWCRTETPHPAELSVYQEVVSRLVLENSAGSSGQLAKSELARFLAFISTHGLRPTTVAAILRQLTSDSLRPELTSKRAVLLDRLQFDLFRNYWQRLKPDFATFFLNSTAHFQHAYWHHAFPEDFGLPAHAAESSDAAGHRDAVLFGYQKMDALLAEFFELERKGATLVLTTALSQQASGRLDRQYYRPRDVGRLLASAGITYEEVLPVMSEQASVRFRSPSEAAAAQSRLTALRVDGRQLLDFGRAHDGCIFFGVDIREPLSHEVTIEGLQSGQPVKFFELFYALEHTKAGMHHPDSVLWWKSGSHTTHTRHPSILDILPTIAEYFSVSRDSYDRDGRLVGQSLMREIDALTLSSGEEAAAQAA